MTCGRVLWNIVITCSIWLSCAAGYAAPAKPKVLNNFVSELLTARMTASPQQSYEFSNPRNGWVFLSTTVDEIRPCSISVFLQRGASREIVILHQEGKTAEAMRLLPPGNYKIDVRTESKPSATLIVRTMPEIIFSRFSGERSSPDGAPYLLSNRKVHGADRLYLHHWDFLLENILRNVNVICGTGLTGTPPPYLKKWLADTNGGKGRKLIQQSGFHFKGGPDAYYTKWSQLFRGPFDGAIIDEFIPPDHHIDKETMNVIKRIRDNPELKGTFYAYWGLPWNVKVEKARMLIETIMACPGYKSVFELYLWEQATEEKAKGNLDRLLRGKMLDFRKAFPGSEKSCIICLSILRQWDRMPHVDFKVWLDMQFRMMAKDPAFKDLGGVTAWMSNYADPEIIRWMGHLYRHYCIEGKTEMVSPRYGFSLMMNHLENAGFAAGQTGWDFAPAEAGTLQVRNMADFPIKTTYMPKYGNGVWMRRSAKKPNRISQEITNLKPGGLYSVRMYACDVKDVVSRQTYAISVRLKGAAVIKKESLQEIQQTRPRGGNTACWNYIYRVFRATSDKANIEISDWAEANTPGGPIDQEILFHFIQIQPFFEGDKAARPTSEGSGYFHLDKR